MALILCEKPVVYGIDTQGHQPRVGDQNPTATKRPCEAHPGVLPDARTWVFEMIDTWRAQSGILSQCVAGLMLRLALLHESDVESIRFGNGQVS